MSEWKLVPAQQSDHARRWNIEPQPTHWLPMPEAPTEPIDTAP